MAFIAGVTWDGIKNDRTAEASSYYYGRYPEIMQRLVGDSLEDFRSFSNSMLRYYIPLQILLSLLLVAGFAWFYESQDLPKRKRATNAIRSALLVLLMMITAPVWVSLGVISGLLMLLVLGMMRVTIWLFSRAIGLLEGDQRLRDLFVSAGIFLFILGNLLQLLATF